MLAAIVPSGDQDWFFKVMGPKDSVSVAAEAYRDLLKSISFSDGKPQWSLPEGWREIPGSGMRFATLQFDAADETMEVSIMALPRQSDLANVNRWRGQLNLPPISEADMATKTEKIEFKDGTATLVDLVGTAAGGGMSGAPFAGAKPPIGHPPIGPQSGTSSGSSVEFKAPEEWSPAALEVSRGGITLRHEAAFEVKSGDKLVEITVDRMPAGGGLLANINRWRGQIKLDPLTQEQLDKESEKVDIDGQPRDYVKLVGPTETILGVVAEQDGMAWYLKLKGDKELAEQERERFEEFVKSIQLK